ncbi:MAG: helix-turn-helix domain-containing protein [Candidatus Hydrogenedentota bacterium]
MTKLLTTEDAAAYLGVTPARIRQYILEERLKSEKQGRDHLLEEKEVKRFAREGRKRRGRPKKKK